MGNLDGLGLDGNPYYKLICKSASMIGESLKNPGFENSNNIFAGIPGMQGYNQAGDSFKSSNADRPIGQAQLGNMDNQIVTAALQSAGLPSSLRSVAIEHLAAMNKIGNSNSGNNISNYTNSAQEKVANLAEFLQNYSSRFGNQGELTKADYLQNVSQMQSEKMQSEGAPSFIPPNSPFWNAKDFSHESNVATALAFKAVQDTGFTPPAYLTNSTSGSGISGNSNDNNDYQNFYNSNKNNSKYAKLSPQELNKALQDDYKYNRVQKALIFGPNY
ncbi:MAG: hypothetical protein WCG23_08110 [bacterium]